IIVATLSLRWKNVFGGRNLSTFEVYPQSWNRGSEALSPRSVPLDSYLMVMSSLSQLELGSTPVQISV
ncbi:hypothetical protein HN873_013282, partial [Arachis hypogaea]